MGAPHRSIPALAALAALALAGCASSSEPQVSETPRVVITVFVAASLTDPFDELEREFEDTYPGVDIIMNYGGSSGLGTQIAEGAPADVFAAASPATMAIVTDAGLADEPADFATNTLQLVVPAGNPAGVTGLADLAREELAVVLCAIEVPCGAAAQKVLDLNGIVPSVDSYEQDVKAVLTKVRLGEADAGLVYLTDVQAAGDEIEGIAFPQAVDAVNTYQIAAIADSLVADAAADFVAFVLSAEGRAVLERWGFGAP